MTKITRLYFTAVIISMVGSLYSQQLKKSNLNTDVHINCGFNTGSLKDESKYTDYVAANKKLKSNSALTLPVVVHIIHHPDDTDPHDDFVRNFFTSNPNDDRVNEAIKELNQGFGNFGDFNGQTNHPNPVTANVDMGIRFCLAQRDIYGSSTNGIYRYPTYDYVKIQDDEIDDVRNWINGLNNNAFPNTDYINIYVFSRPEFQGNNVGGLAQSLQSGGWIVMSASSFGQIASDQHFRAPLICHEMGHVFGLLHPNQGGCSNNNCLIDGDRVCDTPPSLNVQCSDSSLSNSCSTDADDQSNNNPFSSDQIDLKENFMYFNTSNCTNNFTAGQKMRAQYFLDTYGVGLKNSLGCLPPSNCTYSDFGSDTDGLSEAQCFCDLGYLQDDGSAEPNESIKREDLAKLVYLAVNRGNSSTYAEHFPVPYDDLNGNNDYHNYAKALLYLEYGDGIAPFNRSFTHFRPLAFIEKRYALKVILEAFNIKPSTATSGTIQGIAVGDDGYEYMKKALELGIISSAAGSTGPTNVSRRDVFIMLKRVLNYQNSCSVASCTSCTANPSGKVPQPSHYFTPGNLKLNYLSRSPGISEGYMDLYNQTPYNIPSIGFNLSFSFGYNSFWLELPEELQKLQPMNRGWTHNYNAYIVEETTGTTEYLYVIWPSGEIHQYNKNTRECSTPGVFDILTTSGTNYFIRKKNQTVYAFSKRGDSWLLDKIEDRNGNVLDPVLASYTDANGDDHNYVTRVNGPAGRTIELEYGQLSINGKIELRLVRVIDLSSNRTLEYGYYSSGRLGTYKNAKGNTTTFSYGASSVGQQFLLTKIKYPKGNEVIASYDANRKMATLKLPGTSGSYEFTHEASYTSNSNQVVTMKTKDIANATTTNTSFDNNGHFRQSVNGSTTTIINARNDELQPTQVTHGNKTSRMYYDNRGNITRITTPQGINNYFTYDNSTNDILTVKDGEGYTSTYTYDSNKNLDKIVDNLGYTTDYSINSKGLVTEIKNPENITTSFTYDAHGNQTKVTSPLSIVTNMTYDNIGRTTGVTNPKSQVTNFEYDLHDMVSKVTRVSSGGNVITQYGFDVNDNLTGITNANNGVTSMTYNDYDQLTTQTFGNDTHEYSYYDDGKLDQYEKPTGTVLQHTYDSQGRVSSDGYATYTYDTRSNVTNIVYGGHTGFTYDNDNRVKTVNDIYGKVVSYVYDNNNNVTRITYPGGFIVNYGYDRNNRMTSVSYSSSGTKTITYSYYKDGRLKRMNYPNGTYTTYGYDSSGRMINIYNRKTNGTIISSHEFTLDKLGNHTQEINSGPFSGPPPLVASTQNGVYNDENELTSYSGSDTRWDADGNLDEHNGEKTITWDKHNLVTQYSNYSYTYDGLGLLRQAARAGETRRYAWDISGMGSIIIEYNGSGTPLYYYIHGQGMSVRIKADNLSDARYYHHDFRGSTIAMTDANQVITHSYDYLPYGEIIRAREGDNDNRFTFVGKYGVMHESGGRYNMRARHYDAQSGRFISEDPIWHDNLYPYADGNPLVILDINGNDAYSAEMLLQFEICRTSNGKRALSKLTQFGLDHYSTESIVIANVPIMGEVATLWEVNQLNNIGDSAVDGHHSCKNVLIPSNDLPERSDDQGQLSNVNSWTNLQKPSNQTIDAIIASRPSDYNPFSFDNKQMLRRTLNSYNSMKKKRIQKALQIRNSNKK